MRKILTHTLALLLVLGLALPTLQAQSKEHGALEGRVMMAGGDPLPGVEVVVSSPNLIGGERSSVSDSNGRFRFPALPPGVYTIEGRLDGFNTSRREGIRLSVGMTLSIDLNMQMGAIEEQVVVAGTLPLVDVKDSQTAVSTISKEMIQALPTAQFVSQIVNLAPGVKQDSAFGAATNALQYQIDGVDVSDPELGTAYVFLDYGVVEESKVMGVGAPAEYDGFTGAVFNTVTKTGGNTFSGQFDSFLQSKGWNSSNTDDPALTPAKTGISNVHFSIGGPIKKDKTWFFTGLQYYRSDRDIEGFTGGSSVYDQPRAFFKLTMQPNRDNRFSIFLHGDLYNGNNRSASRYTAPEATLDQRSPEVAWNLSYLRVISDYTFLELKGAGFSSYYKLIPKMGYDISGRRDYDSWILSDNFHWYYHAYRTRYQVNSALSHHADNFIAGSHDFKFGVEFEMNPTKSEWGYTNGVYYLDYAGEPYLAYRYEGYSFNATNTRVSAYLQDNWKVSDRLTINPGVRFNYYRGSIKDVGTVFKPASSIVPRLGVTFDVFGDYSTALKAHWGHYYESVITSFYSNMAPKPDYIIDWWDGTQWVEDYREPWANAYSIDPDIKMPYMQQFTVGLERELIKDLSIGINYIRRDFMRFIDRVNLTGIFQPFQYTVPETGDVFTLYRQLNPGQNQYLVTNPEKDKFPIIGIEPKRTYDGLQLVLNKRFSNRWMLMASYVYSQAKGNNDNPYNSGQGSNLGSGNLYTDPNFQINSEGRLTIDPTHEVKVQGLVVLPLDINLSGFLSYSYGNNYTVGRRVPMPQGARIILIEPLGSSRYDSLLNLDLRLEKTFKIGNTRLGAMVDIFNVFNDGTVTGKTTRIDLGTFGETTALVAPRRFRAGLRLFF